MVRFCLVMLFVLSLSGCGDGGSPASTATGATPSTSSSSSGGSSSGGSSSSGGTSSTTSSGGGTSVVNTATITVDAGPAALNTGKNAYTATNVPYVSVTLCAPGSTSNCQTIDHVTLDTGSVGLRIIGSVLNPSLLSAMPLETDTSGNSVGECYAYVSSYVFGSVRQADFAIGGESVANMPLQIIGDTNQFATVPNSCSSGGGTQTNTVQTFGANGILGVGTTTTDCGSSCTITGNSGAAATYYDCPATGCASIVARASSAQAPFQQLPNPVAAFASDNNGTIISLPDVPTAGVTTLTGMVYFGIGTQANNSLGSATVLPVSTSSSNLGGGLISVTYKGVALNESYIDSGSNAYYFVDSAITACTSSGATGFYCPTSPLLLSPVFTATNGTTATASFTLYNAETTSLATSNAVPGLGANPNVPPVKGFVNHSFDYGLPFFFNRKVYTAIEGRSAGGVIGPYFAY